MSARKLIPLFDRVLVKRLKVEKEAKSVGGILLPDTAGKENPIGKIVATGSGVEDRKLVLKEGDNVLLPDYKGQQVSFEGQTFDMYREDEILGIVETKKE